MGDRSSNDGNFWTIALGVATGLIVFSITANVIDYFRTRVAVAEMQQRMAELAKPDADPFGWRRKAQAAQQQQQAEDRALYALRPGERCIQGQRFRRVENGWIQVNRPCR